MKQKLKKSLLVVLSFFVMFATITVTWHYVNAEEPDNALELDKTATDNSDGTYTINLEAYTTGTVSTIVKSKPTDIIMVLDQSGSMSDKMQFVKSYIPVNSDSDPMNRPNPYSGDDYFIKDEATGEYTPVKHIGNEYYPNFSPIYVWEDINGNRIIGSNKDGSMPVGKDPLDKYVAVQMYRSWEEAVGPTKLESLKRAANTFIDNVIAEGGDHRIAVVGFADGYRVGVPDQIEQYYGNTELFIGSNQYIYGGSSITQKYSSAFQSTKNVSGQNNLKSSISSLDASGATRADLGMDMANQVLANDPLLGDKDRNKVVIMFTDGTPTTTSTFDETVANDAISNAKSLKDSGAKVFTVGVVDTLDNTQDPALETTNELNRYMQYVSSNYPNATSLTNGGAGDFHGEKFLYATDEQSLIDIFSKISEDISSTTTTLDEKTIFKDIISDYFKTPDALDVKVYTSKCTGQMEGKFTWAEREEANSLIVDVDQASGTIDVQGFNYKENFVAINETTQAPRGSKLIVEIKTSKKEGFIGGDAVPTNKVESGIYVEDQLIEKFPEPVVNIDVNYGLPNISDNGIYIGSNLETSENLFDADVNTAGMQYKIGEETYTLNGHNNAFVDIVYTVTKDGNVIGVYTIKAGETNGTWTTPMDLSNLTSNTNLKVDVDVVSTTNKNNKANESKDGKIFVFTPQITVEDEVIFLGEETNLDNLIKDVKWINSDVIAVTPTSPIPQLSYQFNHNGNIVNNINYQPVKDSSLDIKVFNGNKDITAYSDIKDKVNVQVVAGEMTITKNIDQQYTENTNQNANQSFVYRIDVRDSINGEIRETFYQTIDFSANEKITSKSVTLTNLSKGYYTVTEDTDWSWKYQEIENLRTDNYDGNGTTAGKTENSLVFIGDRDHTNGKKFYGSTTGTMIGNIDQSNPSLINTTSNIKDTNILGDAANAINQFTGSN